MQVAAFDGAIPVLGESQWRRRQAVAVVSAVLALGASVGFTLTYMTILDTYVQNDYFWTHFNASGAQAFVSDVFNAHLWTPSSSGVATTLALFAIDVAIAKDYSSPHTTITNQATRGRRIAAEELNDVAFAIPALRATSIRKSARSLTCHCWLDFARRWEVAYTAKRQQRCHARYTDNGAVYLEAMLRNTDWPKWYAMWGTGFDVAYGDALREVSGGAAWLEQTTAALATTTVDAEIDWWRRQHIVRYTISWHNHQEIGFDDAVMIRNVFETFSIPLHHVVSQRGLWSSAFASAGVWNGFYYAVNVNASLVRSASNTFTALPASKSPEMWIGGYPDTDWSVLLHDTIGPIGSIDLLYVLPPRSLLDLYNLLHRTLVRDIQRNLLPVPSSTTALDMTPPKWRGDDVLYAGGNPLCFSGKLLPYVQQSIGFDDACTDPYPPMTVDASPINLVLALWLNDQHHGSSAGVCALTGGGTRGTCEATLVEAQRLLDQWLPVATLPVDALAQMASMALQDTGKLQVQVMQFASRNNTPLVLHQVLLDDDDAAWSVFGWLHLLDWVQGAREVVAFDSDESTVVLVSKQYSPHAFVVDPLATPNRFALALSVLLWYVNGILFAVVALGMAVAAFGRRDLSWRNLVSMNRVAGIVWIGRPLLMLRGLTALMLLSTAKMDLTTSNGFTSLAESRRNVWEAFIVSGESLWLVYAVNDILSLVTNSHTKRCGLWSAGIAWCAAWGLDVASPVIPTASVSRTCVSSNMEVQLSCVSGAVAIGSFSRFAVLCTIQAAAILVSWGISALQRSKALTQTKAPVIIPAVACAHFDRREATALFFDASSSVLSGFLPFSVHGQSFVFSILLWVYLPIVDRCESTTFRTPTLRLSSATKSASAREALSAPVRVMSQPRQLARALMGFLFLIVSIASLASFFVLTESKFTNNFLWEGFNATGMQAFLIDWYNLEAIFRPPNGEMEAATAVMQGLYNGSATSVSSGQYAANTAQFEDLSVLATIAGLQTTSPCDLPWLATQFCWVDFRRRWEVANSDKRQRRCDQEMRINGAVYIEALFRNTDMSTLKTCWGDALDIALFEELRRSSDGRQWIQDVWQNYKSIGLVETLLVQSALGLSYPLTMKRSNGTYRFDLETSSKMYWGWAGDLWAVAHNATVDGRGGSLIRTSATFAFRNHSIEAVMAMNSLVPHPLDAGLSLVRSALGPFGSTDMVHVACPSALLALARSFLNVDDVVLLTQPDAQRAVQMTGDAMHPSPSSWQRYAYTMGGNVLCPASAGTAAMSSGVLIFLTMYVPCGSYFWEMFPITRRHLAFAAIASGAHAKCPRGATPCPWIREVCTSISTPPTTCIDNVDATVQWTDRFLPLAARADIFAASQQLKPHLVSMAIEIVQYARYNASSPVELLRATLLDAADPHFEPIAWQVLYEWALGYREVVSFQGDAGTMTVLSAYSTYATNSPNPLEIPMNLAFYCKLCLQYTTAVMFGVTCVTLLYIVVSVGHIEGLNMMEVNRVAGIVWVGRPLLSLRSLVAILLLATSNSVLDQFGAVTTLADRAKTDWIATLLSGSETCWLVIVLTDVGMAVTKDYTNKYSLYSSVVATAVATCLSLLRPVKPTFTYHRTCGSSQLNFQVECVAGVVQIGSVRRVIELVGLTAGVVVLCYLWERWRHPHFKLPQHSTSLLLPAGAVYLYNKGPWIFNGTLYLDKASAFMCGLIAVSYKRSIYVLDVKTWRLHVIAIDDGFNPCHLSMDAYHQGSIASAVPLID